MPLPIPPGTGTLPQADTHRPTARGEGFCHLQTEGCVFPDTTPQSLAFVGQLEPSGPLRRWTLFAAQY